MIALYTHATGCFVRDSAEPDYIPTFPFYSTEHCLGYLSWRFIIWAGILYFGERMYRIVRSRRQTEIIKVLLHPSGAMEVRFKKNSMKYKAGQWLFLNCPEVSKYQWHPVSPTPSMTGERLIIVYDLLSSRRSIHLGPYSPNWGFHQGVRSKAWSNRPSPTDDTRTSRPQETRIMAIHRVPQGCRKEGGIHRDSPQLG
jgi:hypothetical protein